MLAYITKKETYMKIEAETISLNLMKKKLKAYLEDNERLEIIGKRGEIISIKMIDGQLVIDNPSSTKVKEQGRTVEKTKSISLLDQIIKQMIDTEILFDQYAKIQLNGARESFLHLNGRNNPLITIGQEIFPYFGEKEMINITFTISCGTPINLDDQNFDSSSNYLFSLDCESKIEYYMNYILYHFLVHLISNKQIGADPTKASSYISMAPQIKLCYSLFRSEPFQKLTPYILYSNLGIGKQYCDELKQKINENHLYDVQIADI